MEATVDLFVHKSGKYTETLKVRSVIIFAIVVLVAMTVFPNDYYKVIILIVFAWFVIDKYIVVSSEFLTDTNENVMKNLDKLQSVMYDYIDYDIKLKRIKATPSEIVSMKNAVKLDSLYLDSNMIDFLESILPLSEFNRDQFFLLLKGTNNILKIRKEIQTFYNANKQYPSNTGEMVKTAIDLRLKCLNNIHNFIYTVPKHPELYEYNYTALNRYDTLITRTVNVLHKFSEHKIEIEGVNANTVFNDYSPDYKLPRGYTDTLNYLV